MGSGDKFSISSSEAFGFGIYFSRFPFDFTVGIHFIKWHMQLGFGKGYDE